MVTIPDLRVADLKQRLADLFSIPLHNFVASTDAATTYAALPPHDVVKSLRWNTLSDNVFQSDRASTYPLYLKDSSVVYVK
jgi:hypothetical protein